MVQKLFATPSFEAVLSPLANLTFTHFVIALFALFFIEFSFFIPDLSKLQPYAPFVIHVSLTVLFTITAFFIAESYTTPTLLFVALLYVFVFYRIFALFVYDTQKTQMTVSSLFYQQNSTILSPLAIDFIDQEQKRSTFNGSNGPQFSHNTPVSLGTVAKTPPKIPVLFVFAHPDDESMFFTPLLHLMAEHNHDVKKRYGLTQPPSLKPKSQEPLTTTTAQGSAPVTRSQTRSQQTPSPIDPNDLSLPRFAGVTPALYDIHMLCLTNGDFAGLGKIRETELIKTCVETHKVPPENIKIINEPTLLPDSMSETWSSKIVQRFVKEYIAEKGLVDIDLTPQVAVEDHSEGGNGRKIPSIHHLNFHDLIIMTFDPSGVSGHANHKSCYRGVTDYVQEYNSKLLLEEGDLQNQTEMIKNFEAELAASDDANKACALKQANDNQKKSGNKQTPYIDDSSTEDDDDNGDDIDTLKRRNSKGSKAPAKSSPPKDQMIRIQKPIQHRYISVYGVETVPLWAKYLGPYSATLLIASQYGSDTPTQKNVSLAAVQQERESKLVIPNLSSYQSWLSMATHTSQWVWFRKLFVLFSIYTYITPLVLIQASPLHPSLRHVARTIRNLVMDEPL